MKELQVVSFGKERYIYLSAENSHKLVFKLTSLINEKIAKSEIEKPEVIIGIARGAIAWIKTLADWLSIDQLATFRIVHYADVGKTLSKPKILESHLPRIDKKRVLLFDNVVETGKTMRLATDYLAMRGVKQITTAVLFYKTTSEFIPDFYAIKANPWIIFHFDVLETVKCVGVRWLNEGLKLEEIKECFLKIGIPEKEVSLAMKIIFDFS